MAKAKKKAGMLGIVMGLFVLAFCAMAIAGAFIDEWTVTTGEASFVEDTADFGSMSLEDYKDSVDLIKDNDVNWDAVKEALEDAENNLPQVMVVFGYLTVALAIALAISYLLKMVLNFAPMRIITGLLGIVTLVSGVVLVAVRVHRRRHHHTRHGRVSHLHRSHGGRTLRRRRLREEVSVPSGFFPRGEQPHSNQRKKRLIRAAFPLPRYG